MKIAFDQVQQLLISRRTRTGPRERIRTRHVYALVGQVVCDACDRKMQASRANGYVYYRCRFAAEYALANKISHPRNILIREAELVPALDQWLASQFEPDRVEVTIDILTAAQDDPAEEQHALVQARHIIRECEAKMARYQAVIDAGGDIQEIIRWINAARAERLAAEAVLRGTSHTPARMTRDEIAAVVHRTANITAALRNAEMQDKADLYKGLNPRLTYDHVTGIIRAPGGHRIELLSREKPGHTARKPCPSFLGVAGGRSERPHVSLLELLVRFEPDAVMGVGYKAVPHLIPSYQSQFMTRAALLSGRDIPPAAIETHEDVVHLITAFGLGAEEVGAEALADAIAASGMFPQLSKDEWRDAMIEAYASGAYAEEFSALVRFDPAETLENASIEQLRQAREVATGLAGFGSLLLMHALLMPDTPGLTALRTRISELGMGQALMSLARQVTQPHGIANAIAACFHPMYAELYQSLSELAESSPPLLHLADDETHDSQHYMETWLSALRDLAMHG
jgi:hypothetical protein